MHVANISLILEYYTEMKMIYRFIQNPQNPPSTRFLHIEGFWSNEKRRTST